jgi:HTH-type transcriptional regulator/antitoxin HigA
MEAMSTSKAKPMNLLHRKSARKHRPVTAGYRKLIAKFPLRAIRDDAEHAAALEVARSLINAELDEGAADYFDVLASLIEDYERKVCPMPAALEGDILQLLMDGRGLSQSALARETGIAQSTISTVLTGTRSLTKEQVMTLAAYFNVSPIVFLRKPAQELGE